MRGRAGHGRSVRASGVEDRPGRARPPGRERLRGRADRGDGPARRAALRAGPRAAAGLPVRLRRSGAPPVGRRRTGLLVIDTRVQHALADGGYGARRAACEAAASELGVAALRDVSGVSELDSLEDPVVRRRARHVVTENQRVTAVAELLRAGQLAAIGPLLTASHVSLRDDFEVSWPEADVAVEAALGSGMPGSGALGARMTGGGFGGSVIALASEEVAAEVAGAVAAGFGRRGWRPPAVTSVVPSQGARRLR